MLHQITYAYIHTYIRTHRFSCYLEYIANIIWQRSLLHMTCKIILRWTPNIYNAKTHCWDTSLYYGICLDSSRNLKWNILHTVFIYSKLYIIWSFVKFILHKWVCVSVCVCTDVRKYIRCSTRVISLLYPLKYKKFFTSKIHKHFNILQQKCAY
jgi:hypothetical protein